MTENTTPDAGPESAKVVADDSDTEGHAKAIPDPDAGPERAKVVADDDMDTEGHTK